MTRRLRRMLGVLLGLGGCAAAVAADTWSNGTYRCVVDHAVGIQLFEDQIVEGRLQPDPQTFTLTVAPLAADCGDISVAHTTVGIALRCTDDSTVVEIGDELGGTLYQWAFPGPTYINILGTTLLKLGRDGSTFMWAFATPDYSSTYQGRCEPLAGD